MSKKEVVKGALKKLGIKGGSKTTPDREVMERLMRRKKPTQDIFADKYNITEGARLDPDTLSSVKVAREVATKGEKVNIDSMPLNFLKDMASEGSRQRAKVVTTLEKKLREGTITSGEKTLLKKLDKADSDAVDRMSGKGKRKPRKPKEKDGFGILMKTGEIIDGFNPTPRQLEQASKSAAIPANKKPALRKAMERVAVMEKRDPANKGLKKRTKHNVHSDSLNRGGLVRNGHKDYRKSGMFYGGMAKKKK